jgi:RNA polymerase sigma-70 factor (ECF subfamily)
MANQITAAVTERWVHRLRAGDDQAREQLLNCACERLTRLTHKMLKRFGRVKRWEQTDDVVQNALLRLYRSLADVQPASAVEFYRLAALNIRRELLDLAKHYYGRRGLGANYASVDKGPDQGGTGLAYEQPAAADDLSQLEAWAAFHDQVERLPAEEKEVLDLLWYQELSQAEAAALLQITERTVRRRWASARWMLYQCLRDRLPDI